MLGSADAKTRAGCHRQGRAHRQAAATGRAEGCCHRPGKGWDRLQGSGRRYSWTIPGSSRPRLLPSAKPKRSRSAVAWHSEPGEHFFPARCEDDVAVAVQFHFAYHETAAFGPAVNGDEP